MSMVDKANALYEYWKLAVAAYVSAKRKKADRAQKAFPVSRGTISKIENHAQNFTLSTLLEVLDAVDGNISEAFDSKIPKSLHGDHQHLHEMLQAVLESGQKDITDVLVFSIKNAFSGIVERGKTDKDH